MYGQLLYLLHARLPKSQVLKTTEDHQALLAIVQWCKEAEGDATEELVWYTSMGSIQAVNVAAVQCVIGRVQVGKQWGIIDISFECARTTFADDVEDLDD